MLDLTLNQLEALKLANSVMLFAASMGILWLKMDEDDRKERVEAENPATSSN